MNVVSVSDIATVTSGGGGGGGGVHTLMDTGVFEILLHPGGAYCKCTNNALCIPERFSLTSR